MRTLADVLAAIGWIIRREGDQISVCAPNATPGMKYLSANKGTLDARLLFALADTLLAAPDTQAKP